MALDQRQSAQLHFIGAVNGEIDFFYVCKGRQRNSEAAGLLGCAFRGGDAGETQPFFRDAPAEFSHEVSRGGAGAEANDHAILHELRCRPGSFFLKTVLLARVHDPLRGHFGDARP